MTCETSRAWSRRALLRGAGGGGALLLAARGAGAADAPAARVDIHMFAFAPAELRVVPGATVTWVNHDDSPHSIVVPALKLRSRPIDTGQAYSFRFEQAGAFDYRCGLHPQMRGKVVVG